MNESQEEIREYFLDLISFLKETPSHENGKSAFDILIERRPDIGQLDVNSDTIFIPIYPMEITLDVLKLSDPLDLEWIDWYVETELFAKEIENAVTEEEKEGINQSMLLKKYNGIILLKQAKKQNRSEKELRYYYYDSLPNFLAFEKSPSILIAIESIQQFFNHYFIHINEDAGHKKSLVSPYSYNMHLYDPLKWHDLCSVYSWKQIYKKNIRSSELYRHQK